MKTCPVCYEKYDETVTGGQVYPDICPACNEAFGIPSPIPEPPAPFPEVPPPPPQNHSVWREKEITTKTQLAIRTVIGTIFVVAGVIWSIKFPKTADVFRPDFIASVTIGMGLILPGIVILFFKRLRVLSTILSILLFWSLLLNVVLISWAKTVGKIVQEIAQENSNTTTR